MNNELPFGNLWLLLSGLVLLLSYKPLHCQDKQQVQIKRVTRLYAIVGFSINYRRQNVI